MVNNSTPVSDVDGDAIQRRMQEFEACVSTRSYQRQKDALEQQLSCFLASISKFKTLMSCTADDVIRFLVYKDNSGRTVVHLPSCSLSVCECPKRLAAGSVDSFLGRLRAIF